jgi:hypothetical protein
LEDDLNRPEMTNEYRNNLGIRVFGNLGIEGIKPILIY